MWVCISVLVCDVLLFVFACFSSSSVLVLFRGGWGISSSAVFVLSFFFSFLTLKKKSFLLFIRVFLLFCSGFVHFSSVCFKIFSG